MFTPASMSKWMYHRFQIILKPLSFRNVLLVRKTQLRDVFRPRGSRISHGYMVAYRDGKLSNGNLGKAFMLDGFSIWKDASVAFRKRESPKCHCGGIEN